MSHKKLGDLQNELKSAFPPLEQPELQRDLWPEMLRKLGDQPARVPWFDWALLAALAAAFYFFPAALPVLLYHL